VSVSQERPSALLRWIRASIKACGTVIVRRLGVRKERRTTGINGWDSSEENDMAKR
jgi:hypothetical protein